MSAHEASSPTAARPPALVLALLAGGLLLRLATLPHPGMVDVKAWKAWSTQAAQQGVAGLYGPSDQELFRQARAQGWGPLLAHFPQARFAYRGEEYFVDYPPGSALLLWAVGKAQGLLDPERLDGRLFNALLNLLPLAGAIGVTALLRGSAPVGFGWWRAAAFWANPAVLLAAVLGYQDPVLAFPALGSVLALMRRRYLLAGVLAAAAGLLKPQAILLLPTLLAVVLSETRPREWLKLLLAGLGLGALVLAPWWSQGHLVSAVVGGLWPLREATLSAQGLNPWWIAGWLWQWAAEWPWPLARIQELEPFASAAGFSPVAVGRLLLLAGTLANVAVLLRGPAQDRLRIPLSVLLQVHLYALFGTAVHENHAYLSLVLAPLAFLAWDRARALWASVSALLFANLFLFEGLGRGVIRDRVLWRLRLAAGVDLTVVVALLHVAFVAWLAYALWRRSAHSGDHHGSPGS